MNDSERVTHAWNLFAQMVTGEVVWVDSPAAQPVTLAMIGWEDGRLVAFDTDGNDRLVEDYLLTPPGPPSGSNILRIPTGFRWSPPAPLPR